MLIVNDSDSGEDDTSHYFVNEKPPSFGRATHQRSQISCLVLALAGGMGREGCGWGRGGVRLGEGSRHPPRRAFPGSQGARCPELGTCLLQPTFPNEPDLVVK